MPCRCGYSGQELLLPRSGTPGFSPLLGLPGLFCCPLASLHSLCADRLWVEGAARTHSPWLGCASGHGASVHLVSVHLLQGPTLQGRPGVNSCLTSDSSSIFMLSICRRSNKVPSCSAEENFSGREGRKVDISKVLLDAVIEAEVLARVLESPMCQGPCLCPGVSAELPSAGSL